MDDIFPVITGNTVRLDNLILCIDISLLFMLGITKNLA